MTVLPPLPPLDDYYFKVSRHLDLIEAGAWVCANHARALRARPPFETRAESDLRRCETVLRRSLITVRRAQAIYRRKRVDQ